MTSRESASDNGRCPVQILARTLNVLPNTPTLYPRTDTDCHYWCAHFKSWEGHWLSLLICPLQILARTMTVLTEVSTSNPGKDNDCPYWGVHFKSWQGHWLSLLWCPVQILGSTMTVPTDLPSSNPDKDTDSPYWGVHFKSGKDTDCPYWGVHFKSGKDMECPYWDAQFKFWEAQWLSQLTCQVQILTRTLTLLTEVFTSNLARTLTVLTKMPSSNSGKHNDCPNWPAKFKSWQGHWCTYWCLCTSTAPPCCNLSLPKETKHCRNDWVQAEHNNITT